MNHMYQKDGHWYLKTEYTPQEYQETIFKFLDCALTYVLEHNLDDTETQTKLSRAIVAFSADVDEEVFAEKYTDKLCTEHDVTNSVKG